MDREKLKKSLMKYKDSFYRVRSLDQHLKQEVIDNTSYLENCSFSERIYHIIYDLFSLQECFKKDCNNIVKFISSKVGYKKYCSVKCSNTCENKIETTRKSCIEKYGVSNPMKLQEIQEKVEKTNLKKIGVKYPSQNKEIKFKQQLTFANKSDEEKKLIKEKTKKTCIQKFGVDNVLKSKDIRNKIRKTNLEKYGDEVSARSNIVRKKIEKTCIKKYGYKNPAYSPEVKEKISRNKKDVYINDKLDVFLEYFDLLLIDDYFLGTTHRHNWKCKKCDTKFSQSLNTIQNGFVCPGCFPRNSGSSLQEEQLIEFVDSIINHDIIKNTKKLIPPKEVDIYIPSHNIAIEYNGLWFHSENCKYGGKDSQYHLNKTVECAKKGVQLIHIFEDEWIFKKDIVKNRLKNILGVLSLKRIHARKCIIKEVEYNTKKIFLNKFHLQGNDNSSIKLGAYYNNELVSVMTFSKGNIAKGSKHMIGVWELNRFCSNYNYHIPGIASKLLMHFKRNYEWKQIFSYADRRWSKGDLYYKLGFNFEKETQVNYWYLKNMKRIHRFKLRKTTDEPKEVPEWVLRKNEGYDKIWDCGNLKFVLENITE